MLNGGCTRDRTSAISRAKIAGKAAPGFTPPKQGQYLAFIDAYTRVNRQPPAERDVQRRFGVTPPTVHQMILALKRTGFIRRTPG
ncbi:MAG: helix-turn-helix domain-containing protein [Bradyrhizobium sp.]